MCRVPLDNYNIIKYQLKQYLVNICRKHDKVDQKNEFNYKFDEIIICTYQNNKYLIHSSLAYAMVYQSRTTAGTQC